MACCALEACGNPACGVCTASERFRVVKCSGWADEQPCGLVAGHWGLCRGKHARKAKAEAPATRDGDPKLAGERERKPLAFRPRKREGAFRQQRA